MDGFNYTGNAKHFKSGLVNCFREDLTDERGECFSMKRKGPSLRFRECFSMKRKGPSLRFSETKRTVPPFQSLCFKV